MISAILRIQLLNLKRDKVAFVMTFVLPVLFFSVFALIFGATDRGAGDSKIKVVVADLEQTPISGRFIAALGKQSALEVVTAPDAASARKQVRDGKFPVAVVLLEGFSSHFGNFSTPDETVEMIYDAANPIARNAVGGLLQAAAMLAAPDVLIENGFRSFETMGAGLTPAQVEAMDELRPYLRGDKPWSARAGSATTEPTAAGSGMDGMLKVRSTDVREGEAAKQQYSMIAYYAAGVGVMFLLFSMSGAGGALLQETESGTMERVLSTRASMTHLLAGKWLFLTALGFIQVCVMFLWAELVFHLDLFPASRLVGFLAMASTTAAAAAGFGLVLATACRTREQLGSISTVIILIMSALGGSMVPRFIMPKFMETTALFTFNGWALDGFLKVFWYGPVGATIPQMLRLLAPQLAVLGIAAIVFLGIARWLARRWETA